MSGLEERKQILVYLRKILAKHESQYDGPVYGLEGWVCAYHAKRLTLRRAIEDIEQGKHCG